MEASTSSSSAPSVPLTLRTSIPGLELPPSQYLVPVSFARSHLSTLVNRLLQQSHPDQDHQSTPFDFIVDGQLLRDSLQSWLDKNGKTIEEGVELEYVKSTLPPRWAGAFQHDDWIASIDASRDGAFLTASYDSCLRLFDYASPQEATLTFKVPSTSASAPQSLVAARWVKDDQIATAGMDGAVRLFSVPSGSDAPRQLWWGTHHPISVKGKAVAAPKASMGMPPSALTSLDVAADGSGLVTASRDGSVAYWRFDDVAGAAGDVGGDDNEDEEADGARKRRKAANGKSAATSASNAGKRPSALFWHSLPTPVAAAAGPTSTPAAAGPTHAPHATSRVSAVIFSPSDPTHRALSAGYDGKVIEWDLFAATHGGNPKLSVRQTSDSRSILSMAGLSGGGAAAAARIVTGQMDRSLAFWDLSATGSSTVVIPNAHAGPVYSVSAHPSDAHLFASAGGEGLVKVWDTRSHKRALFTLQKPATAASGDGKSNSGGKLLACEWDRSMAANAEEQASSQRGQVVLAGGEDCTVNVFRGQGIGA